MDESPHISDRKLLAAYVRKRDEASFRLVVERHSTVVWNACVTVLGNEHDAEDAFQETFLKLATKAKRVRWQEDVTGWLFCVARQTAIDHLRRQSRRKETPLFGEPQSRSDLAAIATAYRADVINAAIESLPKDQRAVVLKFHFRGLSREQVAAELSASPGRVKGLLERARNTLRHSLARRGVLDFDLRELDVVSELVASGASVECQLATVALVGSVGHSAPRTGLSSCTKMTQVALTRIGVAILSLIIFGVFNVGWWLTSDIRALSNSHIILFMDSVHEKKLNIDTLQERLSRPASLGLSNPPCFRLVFNKKSQTIQLRKLVKDRHDRVELRTVSNNYIAHWRSKRLQRTDGFVDVTSEFVRHRGARAGNTALLVRTCASDGSTGRWHRLTVEGLTPRPIPSVSVRFDAKSGAIFGIVKAPYRTEGFVVDVDYDNDGIADTFRVVDSKGGFRYTHPPTLRRPEKLTLRFRVLYKCVFQPKGEGRSKWIEITLPSPSESSVALK